MDVEVIIRSDRLNGILKDEVINALAWGGTQCLSYYSAE
jgi:hypothetical protein